MIRQNRTWTSTQQFLCVFGFLFLVTGEGFGQTTDTVAWAPRPAPLTPFKAPNRPLWKLSDILSHHAGEKEWSQVLVDTPNFVARYVLMAPGHSTQSIMYSDDRTFWVVEAGQIRFTIESEAPFVASKGYLVEVPARRAFSLETVGSEPSLRFEVHPAEPPIYPITETPVPEPGIRYIKASFKGHGSYDAANKPYLDFQKEVVEEGHPAPSTFIKDPYLSVEVFRGEPQPLPPATDWGHFRANYPGLWFVLEGKENFLIEGEKPFVAQEGDVVFAPLGRFHRVTAGGDGMSTRLAINARPNNLHWYQPADGGTQ